MKSLALQEQPLLVKDIFFTAEIIRRSLSSFYYNNHAAAIYC